MSNLKVHCIRLTPGMEIKSSLEKFVRENVNNGCFVLSCVGSITKATLRMAANFEGQTEEIRSFNQHFEVLSLNGSLCAAGSHLHICLSDVNGATVGGHVVENLEVFTTLEVMLGEPLDQALTREFDNRTGFKELVVSKQHSP